MLEAYTTLASWPRTPSRARLLALVTGVALRHPGILIKQVSTLDVLSGGRAMLGIGAGWYEQEAVALGVPFPPMAERFEQLEEQLQIAHRMFSGSEEPFVGKHYRLERPLNHPAPLRRPPIMVGGSGEQKTLRLVARYADACNLFAGPDVAHKLDVLREHCDRRVARLRQHREDRAAPVRPEQRPERARRPARSARRGRAADGDRVRAGPVARQGAGHAGPRRDPAGGVPLRDLGIYLSRQLSAHLEGSTRRRHAMGIHRLNHAVLYVSDLKRSVAFYTEVLGFRVVNMTPDGFSAAPRSCRHRARPTTTTWACSRSARPPDPARRAAVRSGSTTWPGRSTRSTSSSATMAKLAEAGALVGSSDHGTTKSLYGKTRTGWSSRSSG